MAFFLLLLNEICKYRLPGPASKLWLRTDRCLIPWRYGRLSDVAWAGIFWGFYAFYSGRKCAPNPGYRAEN